MSQTPNPSPNTGYKVPNFGPDPSIYDDTFYELIQRTRPQEKDPNLKLAIFFNHPKAINKSINNPKNS